MEGREYFRWYKDRDFPEVKSGNDDIVAVIQDPLQLERVINSHNKVLSELELAKVRIKVLSDEINRMKLKDLDASKRSTGHL